MCGLRVYERLPEVHPSGLLLEGQTMRALWRQQTCRRGTVTTSPNPSSAGEARTLLPERGKELLSATLLMPRAANCHREGVKRTTAGILALGSSSDEGVIAV